MTHTLESALTHARPVTLAGRVMDMVLRIELPANHRLVCGMEPITGKVWCEVQGLRPDTYTAKLQWGNGGRRYLTGEPTDGQIARALVGAWLAYTEHEAREGFKIDGVRVFGRHITLDALLGMGRQGDR